MLSKKPAQPAAHRAALGVLMLDTRFPRPPGDIGHPGSFDFPVVIGTVPGASVQRVVVDGVSDALRDAAAGDGEAGKGFDGSSDHSGLLDAFVQAGRALIEQGAIGITTSCGFLTPFQRALAARLPVPVAVSSLLQVALVNACLPARRRCGVITFDQASLKPAHLAAVGAPLDTPVVGMPVGGSFQRTILGNQPELDLRACADELLVAGRQLLAEHPDVAAIVLECTNLPPYQATLRATLGVPVYDVTSLLNWFWSGLVPRHYPVRA